ncbi:RNA polymerase factor sigma-54 [Kyrpidia sp.]|uniref:RNA polymerase factor sigma-54 n=1 Tax=Kyrpidia sp. TaxID=2073077 RepID=UPI00258EE3E4|nr:RNA polymerase factor sigma-54 [Kyrpidia sp.]MCL6576618.1 RNA polymerase factor sigma-54 [Kyrpidia sp.]
MQMGFGLWQQQTQKLILTQELRQAIAILQLSSFELSQYLQQEMAENPVMEWEEAAGAEGWGEFDAWLRESGPDPGLLRSMRESYREPPADVAARSENLEDHLMVQLSDLRLSPLEKRVLRYVIGNIDERGYVSMSSAEMAAHLGVEEALVERCRRRLHGLEPLGIGALDLRECLNIQARERYPDEPGLKDLIDHHLQDVAEGRQSRIAQALQIDLQEVQRLSDLLKTLDPKPGRMFFGDQVRFVIPDVTIERVGGDYVVMVHDRLTPHLHINPIYRRIASTQGADREAKSYLSKKIQSAMWLIRSLEQRRQTILRVTEAIVELQRDFFDRGLEYLRPMTLRQVAERVGVHESTVSRATTGKYAQTPRGVLELKYFFSSGVQTRGGEGASAESIKAKIRKWIQEEDRSDPLSDQRLADLLQQEGIRISRRTVAKYREELRIASSAQRRRHGS